MCVACRTRRPQPELLRFTRRRDGEVVPVVRHPAGRSAYVCASRSCLQRAVQRRALISALRRSSAKGGLVVREIEGSALLTATERALAQTIETLERSGAVSRHLPQLHSLQRALLRTPEQAGRST